MIVGVGIDIVNCSRVKRIYEKFRERFLSKILTEREIEYISKRKENLIETIATRFAAKESFFKALGTGIKGVSWKDVEIFNHRSGKPFIEVRGRSLKIMKDMAVNPVVHISISHLKDYGVAMVIIEDSGGGE